MAVVALDQFLGRTFRSFVPRVSFGVSEQRRDWNDLRLMYVRKRKVRSLEPGLVGPIAKRRLFLTSKRGTRASAAKILNFFVRIIAFCPFSLKNLDVCCRRRGSKKR